jgi:hypothetical protein
MRKEENPKRFRLGLTVATPGAKEALEEARTSALSLLCRHQACDWGDISTTDKLENELSVRKGYRIISAYTLSTGVKLWVITEADRSSTTILLPGEY